MTTIKSKWAKPSFGLNACRLIAVLVHCGQGNQFLKPCGIVKMLMQNRIYRFIFIVGFLLTTTAVSVAQIPVLEKTFPLPRGENPNEFKNPVRIFVDTSGFMYIADAGNRRVVVLNPDGSFKLAIGDKKLDRIGYPADIAIDRKGWIYIVDSAERLVLQYDETGKRRGQIGTSKTFRRPVAVAVDDSANVYVADEGFKQIMAFDQFKRPLFTMQQYSGVGTGKAEFRFRKPSVVRVDKILRLYVLDEQRQRIFVYDKNRALVNEIQLSAGGTRFENPVDFTVNTHGELFCLDAGRSVVYYLSDLTVPVWRPFFKKGKSVLEFDRPAGLSVKQRQFLYVVDAASFDVEKIVFNGLPEKPALGQPVAVAPLKPAVTEIVSSLSDSGQVIITSVAAKKLFLAVTDELGQVVRGLEAADFSLSASGTPLAITGLAPLNKTDEKLALVLVLGAKNLGPGEVEEAKDAIVREILPEIDEFKDKIAIITYAGGVEVALEPESNTAKIEKKLRAIAFAGQQLALYDALVRAKKLLEEKQVVGQRAIILLADEKDEKSQNDFFAIAKIAEKEGFPNIYIMGFDTRKNNEYLKDLRRLSEATGGVYYATVNAKHFSKIAAQLITILKYQYVAQLTADVPPGMISADVNLEGKHLLVTSTPGHIPETAPGPRKKGGFTATLKVILMAAGLGLILALAILGKKPALKIVGLVLGGLLLVIGLSLGRPFNFGTLRLIVIVVVILVALAGAIVAFTKKRKGKCPACGKVVKPEWTACMFCKAPLPAKGGKKAATLTVKKGKLQGRRFALSKETSLGSGRENQIVLDYEGVSRNHARIELRDGRFEIIDLNSTNCTFVNGQKVTRTALKNKDVISLARVVDLLFEM